MCLFMQTEFQLGSYIYTYTNETHSLANLPGTDPEINQGGWLAWFFIYVVIVSITIVANLKIWSGGLAECWPSLLGGSEGMH